MSRLLLLALLLTGCASTYRLMEPTMEPWTYAAAVQRYLDRWSHWQSLTAHTKLKVQIGDSAMTAKGSLIYIAGESYHVSFARPYNQVIGEFYMMPERMVYWGNDHSQLVFSPEDTVRLDELIPIGFPSWNPRDLLPFPVGARCDGLQIIEVRDDSLGRSMVVAESGGARYELALTKADGVIRRETVRREGMEPVFKSYQRTYSIDGWPISGRVICQDASGRIQLTWKLSSLELQAAPYAHPSEPLPNGDTHE